MKIMVVDIETTGLDYRIHDIIQIGAVCGELGKPNVQAFLININPENMLWSQYCLNLHYEWIGNINKQIKDKNFVGAKDSKQGLMALREWGINNGFYKVDISRPGRESKPTVAGKCFGTFDDRFITQRAGEEMFRKRMLDPLHYYIDFNEDGDIPPDLLTCKKRAIATGCKFESGEAVTHDAMFDAFDVWQLLNHAFNMGWMNVNQKVREADKRFHDAVNE